MQIFYQLTYLMKLGFTLLGSTHENKKVIMKRYLRIPEHLISHSGLDLIVDSGVFDHRHSRTKLLIKACWSVKLIFSFSTILHSVPIELNCASVCQE